MNRLLGWFRELRVVWVLGFWAGRTAAFSLARAECGRTIDALIERNRILEKYHQAFAEQAELYASRVHHG